MRVLRHYSLPAVALLLAACAQPGTAPQSVFERRTGPPQAPIYPRAAPLEPQLLAPPYPADPIPNQPAPSAETKWRLVGHADSEPLAADGAVRVVMRATDGAATVNLHLVLFDSRRFGIRVIDQPQPGAGGSVVAPTMRAHHAVAGVNGGFFTPEFQPLGLMIASGAKDGGITNAKLLGGMFLSAGGQPSLLWRSEYAGDRGITDLVQAGPRLVDSGTPVSGLERASSRARTFIATDGHQGWVIGVVKSTSLGELADLLATPGLIPDLRVNRALNLDGGHSSAIWMSTARGQEISEPGWSTVRNFIAIVPR